MSTTTTTNTMMTSRRRRRRTSHNPSSSTGAGETARGTGVEGRAAVARPRLGRAPAGLARPQRVVEAGEELGGGAGAVGEGHVAAEGDVVEAEVPDGCVYYFVVSGFEGGGGGW